MNKIKERIHNDFEKLKLNKEEYFNEFYNNNYNLVYRISFSILKDKENSEDVTQSVFEKIYKLPKDKLAEGFESTWLYTVTKNESLQHIKKSKFNIPLEENLDCIQAYDNKIDDIVENENYKKIVKKLNKKEEQIVSLKVLSEFTFKEIGEILSMPTATVQWYYYKSIKSLKIALSNFAMFVIALVVGLKFEKTTNNEKKNFYVEDELNFTENNKIQDSEQTEEIKSESTQVNVNTNIKNEIIQSTTVESNISDIKTYNKENSTIGIFCIAGVFLVISIIFSIIFIKHQQKVIKKSSKK